MYCGKVLNATLWGMVLLGLLLISDQPLHAKGKNPPPKKWLDFKGAKGENKPGLGKHIVLISGDEEYRSEEAMPQLAKILTMHHGFDCTVLFALDPKTGIVNPNIQSNIPGLKALEKADLMVIFTRFRSLSDDQMKHIDAYLKSGRPVIGMRTSTHAFKMNSDRAYAHYSNGYRGQKEAWHGGFGKFILGEQWVNHHGRHKHESTRGIIKDKKHPIASGIKDKSIWGPSDVYGIKLNEMPKDMKPIAYGQVLKGMQPGSKPLEGKKNNPMMPIAWTKSYQIPGGKKGKVFNTTMGAATDLLAEGTRRMIVNGVYWTLDIPVPEGGAKVELIGTYKPSNYSFLRDWERRKIRIESFDMVQVKAPAEEDCGC